LDLVERFDGLTALDIPFGTYDYELVPVSGNSETELVTGRISVERRQIHVTRVLSGTGSIGDLAQPPVIGSLDPRPVGAERLWVVVENAYGRFRQESTVDSNGRFQFEHIWGNNIVIVCVGSEILVAAPLVVKRNQILRGIRIDLKIQKVEPSFWE